jgi:hypothetical protein
MAGHYSIAHLILLEACGTGQKRYGMRHMLVVQAINEGRNLTISHDDQRMRPPKCQDVWNRNASTHRRGVHSHLYFHRFR